MKVENMTSASGNKVANQFIITDEYGVQFFQSYNSIIVKFEPGYINLNQCPPIGVVKKITLDADTWDYSVTTGKYRNQFLGETKKETQAKIDSGEYKLANLN